MIKVKIKGKKAKIKAYGNAFAVAREIAFGAVSCINEITDSKESFEAVKADVISEIKKLTLADDMASFDYEERDF